MRGELRSPSCLVARLQRAQCWRWAACRPVAGIAARSIRSTDAGFDYGCRSGVVFACLDLHPAPVLADTGITRVAAAAASLLPLSLNPSLTGLHHVLRQADLVVGVGGGYLRARSASEVLKLEMGHLLQMRAARASGKPVVYLPQSIGPVSEPMLGTRLARLLGSFNAVFVRDDRSLAFLQGNANTHRAPDLALLEFGRNANKFIERIHGNGALPAHIALVLRKPPAWSKAQRARYQVSTAALIDRLRAVSRLTFAVQSTVRGNDDRAYYRALGLDASTSLKSVLHEDTPDAVVSVRLHGALDAILHGVPAYHLSYERKGYGAYDDLGLDDWVANAADFDAAKVADTLLAPGARVRFWRDAGKCIDRMQRERARIVAILQAALAASKPS
jgi:polysaccharide pyruvyl transferase WcaK-like protein